MGKKRREKKNCFSVYCPFPHVFQLLGAVALITCLPNANPLGHQELERLAAFSSTYTSMFNKLTELEWGIENSTEVYVSVIFML